MLRILDAETKHFTCTWIVTYPYLKTFCLMPTNQSVLGIVNRRQKKTPKCKNFKKLQPVFINFTRKKTKTLICTFYLSCNDIFIDRLQKIPKLITVVKPTLQYLSKSFSSSVVLVTAYVSKQFHWIGTSSTGQKLEACHAKHHTKKNGLHQKPLDQNWRLANVLWS